MSVILADDIRIELLPHDVVFKDLGHADHLDRLGEVVVISYLYFLFFGHGT